ncbi:helix-turn-helix domain-containing protein [Paenibacillus sp. YN15]|uniref:helix-turn-helix domain-containing protein n=1 Tax=Paenibacillus sp. YN15 TaxID=1742774 RepID=UPI0015EC40C2|nr:helix-turn-helix transcriptional regulator [Paenibacillus sp. YN15]
MTKLALVYSEGQRLTKEEEQQILDEHGVEPTLTREEYVEKMSEEWADVGAVLKDRREKAHLTAEQTAYRVGVSRSTLRRFEKGEPVKSAKVLEAAYCNYLDFIELLRETRPLRMEAEADVLIEIKPDDSVFLLRRIEQPIAVVNFGGGLEANLDAAERLCKDQGLTTHILD